MNKKIGAGCCAALMILMQGLCSAKVQQNHVNDFVGLPGLRHAAVGICVQDIKTGKVLAGNSQEEAIGTASNMKIVTSASALGILGADYTFDTVVKTNGIIKDGTIFGDIIIDAKGDPTLGSTYFDKQERFLDGLCDSLKAKGIKNITGGLIIHEDYATELDGNNMKMCLGDLGVDYSAGSFDFNYRDNLVDLIITNDGESGIKAKLAHDVGIAINNKLRQGGTEEDVETYLTMDSTPEYLLAGTVPVLNSPLVLEVVNSNPQELLRRDLQQILEENHIAWQSSKRKVKMTTEHIDGQVLHEHHSQKLKDIVFSLLVRSDNTFSDALVKEIARYKGQEPTIGNGCEIISDYWDSKGVDTSALFQQDGSGLARRSKATAHVLTDILSKSALERTPVILPEVMPVLGRDRSIGHIIEGTSLSRKISFKSGSMKDVQCYSGYYPAEAPKYSWSILVNNFTFPRIELKRQIDLFLLKLFQDE